MTRRDFRVLLAELTLITVFGVAPTIAVAWFLVDLGIHPALWVVFGAAAVWWNSYAILRSTGAR